MTVEQIITGGDPKKLVEAHRRAVTGAVRSATARMKRQGRKQIITAFRAHGTTIPNALRSKVVGDAGQDITRRGLADDPTGSVFSRAVYKDRPGGPVDLLQVFEEGATVTVQGHPCAAIPTPAAGGRKAPPLKGHEAEFDFAPLRAKGRRRKFGTKAVALAFKKVTHVLWYVLIAVPFRLKPRLKLGTLHQRIGAGVPADIERRFAREAIRLGVV